MEPSQTTPRWPHTLAMVFHERTERDSEVRPFQKAITAAWSGVNVDWDLEKEENKERNMGC